mmetsp:Transcript_96964/g.217017  ORF Transcript_96964/g.217017 Transcript_96964/m.217017 type:complete len:80 (-) Transcript_96964:1012-1251(-)
MGPRPAFAVIMDAKRFGKEVPTAVSVRPKKLCGIPQYLLIWSEPAQTTKAVLESQSMESKNEAAYHLFFDSTFTSGMVM